MLGCGTLVISDASTHGRSRCHDIPHVEEVQRKLNELLARARTTPTTGTMTEPDPEPTRRPDLERAILGEAPVFNALEVAAETGVDHRARRAGCGGRSGFPEHGGETRVHPAPTPRPSRRWSASSTAG